VLNVKRSERLDEEWLIWLVGLGGIHEILAGTLKVTVNRGISFGWQIPMVIGVTIVVLVGLWWWGQKNVFLRKGIDLILAGGSVNLMDRLRFGWVRDYWRWKWFDNNVADLAIGMGVVWILIKIYVGRDKNNL
jgi:lipoprotein signal peptidase